MYHRRVFEDHRPEHLAAVARQVVAEAGCAVAPSVCVAAAPPDAVSLRFLPGASFEIGVPAAYPSEERRQFFTNRWMATLGLLAHAKQRYPELRGSTLLWLDDWPSAPGLAFCGNAVSHVLIPDQVFLETDGYSTVRAEVARTARPWGERADLLFWRGASTGNRALLRRARWQDLPRFKLCLHTRDAARPDLFDVGLSDIVQVWDEGERAAIAGAGVLRDAAPQMRFMDYRYSVDIDGNTCSWPGLFTKLLMGVTTLKVDSEMGFRQWTYDQLVPWRNVVPVAADMGELVATMEWLRAHPRAAEDIAEAGQRLAQSLTHAAVLDAGAAIIARFVGR